MTSPCFYAYIKDSGVEKRLTHRPHKPEIGGSNPPPRSVFISGKSGLSRAHGSHSDYERPEARNLGGGR